MKVYTAPSYERIPFFDSNDRLQSLLILKEGICPVVKILACIFDLDGVIVDTAKYHFQAWQRLAHELGFEFTEKQNERLKGVSRARSLEILLEIGNLSRSEAQKEALAHQKNTWYVELINQMTPDEILPGAKEFLQALKEDRIKIGLGSASKNAMTILQHIDMDHFFDTIIDGNKVSKAKPDPEVFLKGAEALNVAPQQCVVFEDAQAGIEAARNGRMPCVGVGSIEHLHAADFVIGSLQEITPETLLKFYAKINS